MHSNGEHDLFAMPIVGARRLLIPFSFCFTGSHGAGGVSTLLTRIEVYQLYCK